MFNKTTTLCKALLISIVCTPISVAQVEVTEAEWGTSTRDSGVIIEMTVSPAAQPNPTFANRLTYLPRETDAGNAATLYMHSLGENLLRSKWKQLEQQFGDEVYDWSGYEDPPNEAGLVNLKQASAKFDEYIAMHIERASKRRQCDWGLGLEDLTGPMVYGVHLNGLQETRSISRALALQTKLAILESRFDDAIHLMRMNYRLGENVGNVEMLVGSLIAIAEVGITNRSMINFIAAPDSPNMYWALSELPSPMVDVRGAIRMECGALSRIFPEIASAETADHSVEEWSRIVQEMPRTQMSLTQMEEPAVMNLIPAAIGVMTYAPAKERLLKAGYDAKRLEEMAVGQVLLIDANLEQRKISERVEREAYLPFWVSNGDEAEEFMKSQESGAFNSFGKALSLMILPAIQQVRQADMRVQRDIDALRLIEALRMHASETGSFPASLDEIKAVPIPDNPATGKPFQYQLEGQTAVIELPRSDGIVYSKRFRVSLRK